MLSQTSPVKPADESPDGAAANDWIAAHARSVGRALTIGALAFLNSCATNQSTAPRSAEMIPEIRSALSEPSRPPVPNLPPDVARELLPPPELSLSRLSTAPAEPRFDLNVVQLPASQVFAALAKDTRYSMVIDPELKTPITVTLKDVSLVEALETLREAYGFEYKILGTRIFVQAAGLETRVFTVNYPTESRTGRSELHVTSGSITQAMNNGTPGAPGSNGTPPTTPAPGSPGVPSATESTRITTQIRNDLWVEIEASLKLLVPVNPERRDGTQLIVSPQSGVIVVRALPRQLRQVEHYLRSMRLNIERQIVLEAKIIEVTLNDSSQTGINWAAFHNGAGARSATGMLTPGASLSPTGSISDSVLTSTPGALLSQSGQSANPLFGLAFQTNNFAGLLEFLQTQGELQVISSPRITAMNNQQAVLKVGTDDFFVTGVTTNIATGTGSSAVITPTITVEPFFSGVAFDITPSVDEDGSIILHVHPSVSAVSEKDKIVNLGTLGSYTLPLASSTVSETDTVVRGRDGNIVAIGGLMTVNNNDTSSGLPGLGTVPGLGYLFSSKQKSRTKTELVILIKPTVVNSDAQLQAERDDFQRRLEGDLSAHVH
ncbi:MAG TPA: pilus (MSHA type) biogenesis protein MshL [Burkholderiaceae bacterium]|nr:pilus (MSHA type) biogenesis protein MshL [Burkholderiaceae bacterium]